MENHHSNKNTLGDIAHVRRNCMWCSSCLSLMLIWCWYGGFHSHGGTPIAGWLISWKTPLKWIIGGYPYFRKPPYIVRETKRWDLTHIGSASDHIMTPYMSHSSIVTVRKMLCSEVAGLPCRFPGFQKKIETRQLQLFQGGNHCFYHGPLALRHLISLRK